MYEDIITNLVQAKEDIAIALSERGVFVTPDLTLLQLNNLLQKYLTPGHCIGSLVGDFGKPAQFPDGIVRIGDSAFYRYDKLTSQTLPNSVKEIGDSAFYKCTNWSLTQLPPNLEKIGNVAFSGASLVNIKTIPGSVKSIGFSAFYNCPLMTELTFLHTDGNWPDLDFTGLLSESLVTIRVPWPENAVEWAPWGADNATIIYNYTPPI